MVSLWDAGLDYLTMTFEPGHSDYARVLQIIDVEMEKSAGPGHDIEPFTWNGYTGRKQGKLAIGQRQDGMMVRCSGARSRLLGNLLKEKNVNGKTTRIDFQTTAKVTTDPGRYLSKVRGAVESSTGKESGRKARNTAAYKTIGSDSGLAIGSRSSESYFRIYNKSLEQRGKVEPGLIRFENECKGKRARVAWNMFRASATPYYLSCSIVKAELQNFGVDTDFLATGERVEFPSSWEPTNTEKQLNWLQFHVRPTVLQLIDKIGRDAVIDALGLA